MIDKIKCLNKIGGDNHKYLIALLQYMQTNNNLPEYIAKSTYYDVKANPKKYDDWYVGIVGFCGSYGSKWFGGYVLNPAQINKPERNRIREAIKNLEKQKPNIKDVQFKCCDYRDFKDYKDCAIYYDPPYENTLKYSTSKQFDYNEFWDTVRQNSKDNIVFVSEYHAPEDFKCIVSINHKTDMDKNASERVEKLFTFKNGKYFND